jgi:hypothetical protein
MKDCRISLDEFMRSPNLSTRSPALQALWYDKQGDWKAAHESVQAASDVDSAWVHAYLHRKEGDPKNASYWYRRSGKPVSQLTLEQEWEQIATALLF